MKNCFINYLKKLLVRKEIKKKVKTLKKIKTLLLLVLDFFAEI